MKPIAVIGAILTIALAFFVVSKLTTPSSAVSDVAVTPPTPAPEASKDETKPDGEAEKKPEEEGGVTYQQNPFDLAKPGPYPKAVLVQERFEFGEMPLGSTKSHPFVIKNEGDAPLKLEKGPLQCKCTMPALKDKEIPPGGQAEVILEWKPLAVQAGFEKEATIWTNDPANPRLGLQIFGDVVSDDFWEPTDNFNLEPLEQGKDKTLTGFIGSRTRDDLKIEKIDQVNNSMKVEYEPADEALLKEKNAKVGYVVKITVPPSDEIALIRETVTVTVNSATNTHIIWQVVGSRVGPINIIGNGWYADKQLIQLGHFSAAKGAEKTFSLILRTPGEQPMAITDVKAQGPLEISLVKDEKWAVKTNERYFLTVKFSPGGAIGVRNTDNPVPVTVSTNHPKIATMNFNVSYDAD
jgi:hypothetical protein